MSLLPDELWEKILRELVDDAVDWAQFSLTCRRHYYHLPRPRPVQFVVTKQQVRYPHVLWLQEIIVIANIDGDDAAASKGEPKEHLRLLCFNSDWHHEQTKNVQVDDGGGDDENENVDRDDKRQQQQSSATPSLTDILCRQGARFRIFTYCDGDKAYLEPFFYNSAFYCADQEERRVEGYGLVFHYEAAPVKALYKSAYHANLNCYWQIQRQQQQSAGGSSFMELRYGDEHSSMRVDFDSYLKAFLLIRGPVWENCRLEDYNAELPFFLSRSPPFWHEQWRQRLYQAIPCQPRPFVCHSYQTNLFAPDSWEDVDYTQDEMKDFIITGQRTAAVKFSLQLRDSHIIIRALGQSFALRMPLLQQDLELFTSCDPAAWLQHLFERRSRRWFVARKYWRLAADVEETQRQVAVETIVRDWPALHPDYVYQVDNDGDFLLKLPTVEVAKDPDTEKYIQQYPDEQDRPQDRMWCVVLHG